MLRSGYSAITPTVVIGLPRPDAKILDVSSTDPVITGALAALDAARKALGEAHQRLADSNAVPDVADIAETTTLVAAVAENLMKGGVNGLMIGRAIADSQGAIGI